MRAAPPSLLFRSLPLLAAAGLFLGISSAAHAFVRAEQSEPLRIGFTFAMFNSVNENDARASIKSLAATIARERAILADLEPHLYPSVSAAAEAMRSGEINALGLTTPELWDAGVEFISDHYLAGVRGDDPAERYVVLVHRGSGMKSLADLRGRRLAVTPGPRMTLAPAWFDLELNARGLPPAIEFLDHTTGFAKPSKAVLALFFRQIDACLVTRAVFDTMVELNPQVAQEIDVIASSPPLIPSVFVFSRRLPPEFLAQLLQEFGALHRTPAGQQVLTIFQTDRISPRPASTLEPAFHVLESHARLFPTAKSQRTGSGSSAPLRDASP